MARFGQYETDRPLYRTGFSTIYLSQSDGKGSHRRVVKAYQPSVRVRDEELSVAPSDAFLDSAGVQQKAAGKDARYWAPIHESGASPEGAFYVTDHYDLSAQQLIDGRANLGAAGLCRIVESVVRGLLALKRACGRPHGNLKFTNILISRRGALAGERVVLSDPCPDRQLDEDTHAKMDLRQLGVLIHQLVTHRNPPLVAGYQAPDSPQWQRLGRQAGAWRDLCNRLLTMDVAAEPITLESLLADLPGVAGRGRKRILKAVACVCVVALLAVLYRPLARVAMDIFRPPDPEAARLAYGECCEAANWLGPLWYDLAKKVAGTNQHRRAYWEGKDESLKELARQIVRYGEPFEISQTEIEFPASPPEKLATRASYQRKVLDANDALEKIGVLLSDGPAGWQSPKELAGHVADLRTARCESMADYVENLCGSIRRRDERLAEHIDDVLYLKGNWDTVQYGELEPNAVAADADLTAPVRDARDFVEKLKRLPGHYRQEIGAFADLLEAERRLRDLLAEVIASGDTQAEKLHAELETDISTRIVQIRATPFTRANAPRVTEECRSARNAMEQIEQQIKGADQWFDEWRAQAAGGISASPAINSAHAARLDGWIGPDREAFAARYKGRWSDLRLLRDKVDRTRENLRRLDAGLPKTLTPEPASAPWVGEVGTYYENTRREGLLVEITAKLAGPEVFPDANGYPPDCARLLDWPGQTMALLRDFGDIERGLDNCHLLEDRPAGARADIQSLYLDPNNRRILEDGRVRQILGPIVTRLEGLETIRDRVHDVNALLELAGTAPHLEAQYAAWRRLVSLPLVEEKWQEEERVGGQLKAELASRRRDGRLAEVRWAELTGGIDRTGETRERRFHDVSIDRLAEWVAVKAQGAGVSLLQQLGQFKPANDADLSAMRAYHACLKSLWDNDVSSADWPAQYDLSQFDRDRSAQVDLAAWLSGMPQYRRIEDRRDTARWDEHRQEIDRNIDEGLGYMADDADVTAQLARAKTELRELDGRFGAIRDLPAIEKHRARVEGSSSLWNELTAMEDRVSSLVHPAYRHLTFRNGPAVFKDAARLGQFEPIDPRFAPFTRAGLADDFFEVIDPRDKSNAGWPKFIRARKDNTVILAFVPGDGQTPPFYIGQREITNEQYVRFLKAERPANWEDLVEDPLFWTTHPYPPAISPDGYTLTDPNRVDHPVAWVTYKGARSYAEWLVGVKGSGLPKVSWHQKAAARSQPTGTTHNNPMLYHIRTELYWAQVDRYNKSIDERRTSQDGASLIARLDEETSQVVAPVGAVREAFDSADRLPQPPIQLEQLPRGVYPSIWPMASRGPLAISDLIGNVWEWCEKDPGGQPVLCGGSCLSPLAAIRPGATEELPEDTAECDLGFRVAIPCP